MDKVRDLYKCDGTGTLEDCVIAMATYESELSPGSAVPKRIQGQYSLQHVCWKQLHDNVQRVLLLFQPKCSIDHS